MSLLAELKRRNVIRMAGLYLAGAWQSAIATDATDAPGGGVP